MIGGGRDGTVVTRHVVNTRAGLVAALVYVVYYTVGNGNGTAALNVNTGTGGEHGRGCFRVVEDTTVDFGALSPVKVDTTDHVGDVEALDGDVVRHNLEAPVELTGAVTRGVGYNYAAHGFRLVLDAVSAEEETASDGGRVGAVLDDNRIAGRGSRVAARLTGPLKGPRGAGGAVAARAAVGGDVVGGGICRRCEEN